MNGLIANGSLPEVQTQIILSQRLGYINGNATAELLAKTHETGRLITGLRKSLVHKSTTQRLN